MRLLVGSRRVDADQPLERGTAFAAVVRRNRLTRARHGDEIGKDVAGCNSTSMISCVADNLPRRMASSTVSNTCAKSTRSSKPKMPAPPLTEWTARKTALIVSSELRAVRISVSPASICCSSLAALVEEGLLQLFQTCHDLQSSTTTCSDLRSNLADGGDQTLRIERLDHPAGGAGFARQILLFDSLSVVSTRIGVVLCTGLPRSWRITS